MRLAVEFSIGVIRGGNVYRGYFISRQQRRNATMAKRVSEECVRRREEENDHKKEKERL